MIAAKSLIRANKLNLFVPIDFDLDACFVRLEERE